MVHGTRSKGAAMAALLLAVAPSMLLAEPYWIAYEGNEYPEDVGWRRTYGDENGPYAGGAERSLAGGVFTIDSMRHDQIVDFYRIQRLINPGMGEVFRAEWRVLVDPVSDADDAGVLVARDSPPGYVSFKNGPDGVLIKPGDVVIPLDPGVFHSFSVESSDMERFDLSIDGVPAYSGLFETNSLLQSYVFFGDSVQGARSLTHWDYVRFGVVPEPAVLPLLLVCTVGLATRAARVRGASV
jgi:hypothetical protein